MPELLAAAVLLAVAWSLHGVGGLLLAVLILSTWWIVSRLLWPYKPCPRCEGTGRNMGSNKRRHGDCKRCKGTRRVRRFGAAHVHRAKLSILSRKK